MELLFFKFYLIILNLSLISHGEKSYNTRIIEPIEKPFGKPLEIKIGVLLPNDSKSQCQLMKVLPAIDVAIDYVRNNLKLFRNASFSISYSDSGNSLSKGPLNAIDMFIDKAAAVLLGPINSFIIANVVRFSSYRYKIPILTTQGFASDLGNKNVYSLLTRLSGTYKDMGVVFEKVFWNFNWTPKPHITVVIWYIWHKSEDYECQFQTKPIIDNFKLKGYKYIEISDEIFEMGDDAVRNSTIPNLIRISQNARS